MEGEISLKLVEIVGKGFKKYYYEDEQGRQRSAYFGSKERAKAWKEKRDETN